MKHCLTNKLKSVLVIGAAVTLLLQSVPVTSLAWTSAQVTKVDVTLDLAKQGPSKVHTIVKYTVNGGDFHGFDLADLAGATLVEQESRVIVDDGRILPLKFRPLGDGRTRVVLADKASAQRGNVRFELVHTIDLQEERSILWKDGNARLDWTPILWNNGLDTMTVKVNFPGRSTNPMAVVDTDICKNYEVTATPNYIELTKFRPVKWYAMRVVVDFDRSLIPGLESEIVVEEKIAEETALAATSPTNTRITPRHIEALPAAIVLIGLFFLIIKLFHVRRVHKHAGLEVTFVLLGATPLFARILLAIGAAGLGVWAQYMGSIAAGIPALVAATALLMIRSKQRQTFVKGGGMWRQMNDEDLTQYRRIVKIYKRMRSCPIDITTPGGVISFGLLLAGLTYVVLITKAEWTSICWITVMDGLLLAIPAWFSNVRSELPVDATIEGFNALRKWRKSLSKLVGAHSPDSDAAFWVREDGKGPVEVRLRVGSPPAGLYGIEVAGEVILSGGTHKTRTAVVLRAEPGTETARRLATCCHAVEHHLTPDLQEEIIVLRNRRGRKLGLAPLRSALALL